MDEILKVVLQDDEVRQMLVEKFKAALKNWQPDGKVISDTLNHCVGYILEDGFLDEIMGKVAEQAIRERFGIEEKE